MKKLKLLIYFLLLLLSGNFSLASNGNQQTPSTPSLIDIIKMIEQIIRNVAIAGAVLMIVIAGFEWMTSAGDPGKISDAKDRIYSAIFGLIIIALTITIASLLGAVR